MADDIKVVGLANPSGGGKTNWKVIGAIIGVVVLALGVFAGILLVRQQQNISEEAAGNCDAGTVVQCPRSDGALVSCNPPDANNNAQISLCNAKGRVEVCDGRSYCCPTAGGAWTTNMTACNATATPTATATATATATVTATLAGSATSTPTATATATSASSTATATPTKTATATATALADGEATAVPVPETGASWPTMVGAGFGLIMIIASMALAL